MRFDGRAGSLGLRAARGNVLLGDELQRLDHTLLDADKLQPQAEQLDGLTLARNASKPIDDETGHRLVISNARYGDRNRLCDIVDRLVPRHEVTSAGLR